MSQVYGGSRFYLDYLAGRVDRYFTHAAGDAEAALRRRQAAPAPRPRLGAVLRVELNEEWRGGVEGLRWLRYLRDVEHDGAGTVCATHYDGRAQQKM